MEVYNQLDRYDARPAAVTIGVFDGLHKGHFSLLKTLVSEAKNRGLVSVVVTFEQHPRIVLSKGNDHISLLTTAAERTEQIALAGVDRMIVLPFTREFSDLTARQFMASFLRDKIGAQFVLLGYNHHFGSDELQPDEYISVAKELGLQAKRAEPFCIKGIEKISSSEIRKALYEGNISRANIMLGRSYSLFGEIVHGDAIGRTIGIPTANIVPFDEHKCIPADGVYLGSVSIDGSQQINAVINVGSRPTVGGNDRRIEAHLIDFNSDIYGRSACVYFSQKLRDEAKFDDINALKSQIENDMKRAREILSL